MDPPRFEDLARHVDRLVEAVLAASDPARAVREHWPPGLNDRTRVHVLALGKASLAMGLAAIEMLGGRCAGGLATLDPELAARGDAAVLATAGVTPWPADHPFASQRNLAAAREVARFVDSLAPADCLLVLLSGGASAHLSLPAVGLTLQDLVGTSMALMRAGATIRELNCVRKHLEQLKGGRLARRCHAGRIVVLALSDVIGDPLDAIGSGPFAPDPTTFGDALDVLRRCGAEVAPGVRDLLERGECGALAETPKPGDASLARADHRVIAGNAIAVDAAGAALVELGFSLAPARRGVESPAADVAAQLVEAGLAPGASAWLVGSEPTVRVGPATGSGGPSQELALAGARLIAGRARTAMLAFSTDGRDGPTDAAGAVVTGQTWERIARSGLDPAAALANHDSHAALDRVGALIRTGPTGTNVNHIAVFLRY